MEGGHEEEDADAFPGLVAGVADADSAEGDVGGREIKINVERKEKPRHKWKCRGNL